MSEAICWRTSDARDSNHKPYLAPHMYAAEVDGGAILLDLCSLQYYALDALSLPALRRDILDWPQRSAAQSNREPMDGSDSPLDSLASRGFLSATPPNRRFSPSGIPPQSACHPNWNIRAKPNDVLFMLCHLATAYARALACLRARRLDALLTHLAPTPNAAPARSAEPSPERIILLVTLYAKLRVWFYTAKDRCLLDSLVLLAVLRKYNMPATITIGVAPKPFSAHAWVQIHDFVLDDSVEHVREYTPILVA
jgi:hypothetical protein